jgi:hypothetical protein
LNLPVHFYYCDCPSADVGNERWMDSRNKVKAKSREVAIPKRGV